MSSDAERYGACGYALGQLGMAAQRSEIRALWLGHETARVVSRLFARGAEPISPEDLLIAQAGLSQTAPSLAARAARRFWNQAVRLWRQPREIEPGRSVPEITNRLAELAEDDIPPGDLALEAPIRFAALTGLPLPAVALALPSPREKDAWMQAFADGLASTAAEALGRLEELERDLARWQQQLPRTRSDSRLRDALVLLGTFHSLSPRTVAQTLGLTRQASARLLRRLEACGIVRQGARRQRWLVYFPENLAAGVIPENTTAPTPLETADIDRVLDEAYRALDHAVRLDEL